MECGQSSFVHRRNVRHGGHPCFGGYGVSFDGAAADLRNCSDCISNNQIDPLGHQILHRGSTTAIMYKTKVCSRVFLKEQTKDMLGASRTGSPRQRLIRICLQPCDQTLQVVGRHRFPRDHNIRNVCQVSDRCEIVEHVVREPVDGAIEDMRAPDTLNKRITIGDDRATRPTPMLPAAPLTFSITIGCPSNLLTGSVTMRASVSAGPPTGKGTTQMIGRLGKSSAFATNDTISKAAAAPPKSVMNSRRLIRSPGRHE